MLEPVPEQLDALKEAEEYLENLMQSYLEGLLWCMAYYSQGCISWDWYFLNSKP